jgi:hypothetical protein
VAASANAFAVALLPQGPETDKLGVHVARFDRLGHRTGLIDPSVGTSVQADADPVLAIAPNGDIIVSYTDFEEAVRKKQRSEL